MKPQELFSGQAPQAMAQMGQNWGQVGASIANSTLAGYEGMARGIGAGISSIAEAYAKHKEIQQTNKAYENLIKNPVAQKALGLNPDTAQQYLMAADNLGTKEKHQLFSSSVPMLLQQSAFQQKSQAELNLAKKKAQYDYDLAMEVPFAQATALQYGQMLQNRNMLQKGMYGGGQQGGLGTFDERQLSLGYTPQSY